MKKQAFRTILKGVEPVDRFTFVKIAGLSLLLLLAAASAYAHDGGSLVCTDATLHGKYGFTVTGTRPSGPTIPGSPPPPIEQIVGVALTHFNGDGTFTQTDNIHGSISGYPESAQDRPGSGTYDLKANCTGTMTLNSEGAPVSLTLRIVVVDSGKEVRTAVVSPPPVMVTSNGRRTNSKRIAH
jgi:hypothetical protein